MSDLPNPVLTVAMVQATAYQHDVVANLANLEELLASVSPEADVVLLPEMFNTGYTTDTEYAERANQQTHKWMRQQASRLKALIVGSIMWREGDLIYNRILAVGPNTELQCYNKHHLFSLAGEDKVLKAGDQVVSWDYKGWILRPVICYDIRFPEWMRRTAERPADCYLVSANWPNTRIPAWDALLPARAVENQSYLVAVNRAADPIGAHSGRDYGGRSAAYSPEGDRMVRLTHMQGIQHVRMAKQPLLTFREDFPFWLDIDSMSV
jgi:predicted amidohydrolase